MSQLVNEDACELCLCAIEGDAAFTKKSSRVHRPAPLTEAVTV